MENNSMIVKGLFYLSLLFIFLLLVNEYYIKSSFLETVFINLITGCFVSVVISLIEYRNDLSSKVKFFHSEIIYYYSKLYGIKHIIENDKISNKEKKQWLNSHFKEMSNKSIAKPSDIKFEFLWNNKKKNVTLRKVISELYDLSFGIDLLFIDVDIKNNKNKHKELLKLVNNQIERIDKGMSILKVVNKIDLNWSSTKNFMINHKYCL